MAVIGLDYVDQTRLGLLVGRQAVGPRHDRGLGWTSERAHRRYDQAEKWARKLGWLGVLVAYVPIPLPIMPVVFVLTGASGMKVRWFIALDFVAATIWNLGYLGLGWGVGDPIVDALKYYAKIANWVAIALIIVILAPIFVKKKQKA